MGIAALVVWALTAAAGFSLLVAVTAARRGEGARRTAPVPEPAAVPHAGAGEHPLREFTHPALGIAGLACWLAFVATHFRGFAWLALAVLLATAGAGLAWLASHVRSGHRVPARLAVLHGLAAAITFGLAALAALVR